MAASKESIAKVKALSEKRASDTSAQKEWDKLVKAYDKNRTKKTPPDIKGKELDELIPKLAAILDKKEKGDEDLTDDCDETTGGPCGDGPQFDLEGLAERVFDRLLSEARLESQRAGWLR